MKKRDRMAIVKASLLVAAGLWHAWLIPGSVSSVLWGVLPYFLLVTAWRAIRSRVLLAGTLAVLVLSDLDAGLGFRQSASSTASVGLLIQVIFACGVVGVAVLVSYVLHSSKQKDCSDPPKT